MEQLYGSIESPASQSSEPGSPGSPIPIDEPPSRETEKREEQSPGSPPSPTAVILEQPPLPWNRHVIVERDFPHLLKYLTAAYVCANCRAAYTLAGNLGTMRCKYHPGYLHNARWSCCGVPYTNYPMQQGCVACDHHIVPGTVYGNGPSPIALPMIVAEYLRDRGYDVVITGRKIYTSSTVPAHTMIDIVRSNNSIN